MASTIGFRIARLPHLWRSILDRRLAPLGLTQTRWVTLYHLWKLGEGNPQCDLARAIGVEAPSLVRTLGQLEAQGLVERRACDDDRRSKRLYLTPAAIPLLEQIDSVVLAARQEMLAGLSEQDLDQLDKWLALIESNGLAIQTRDQDSPTA
ncbi:MULTISPECIES: transcriptional regulator SlyA [Halomonadaceae]|jgi:MarR family transcriptional regulator for hemolysin|uniref:MarR family transcriptional regulator, transcriptional regulator for hemolysin n=1 Tax=Vreelandella aquamarina TaxID=77097 RepID=A0A1N6DR55_9GAMM|nr:MULTISPECIES: transcriptional regulator SlyA [Halomonas]KTG25877.1 transcriptional regulator [Idiomarina sp. H105]MEC9021902.1 transcriptional regulator SlyA [Pseudomonadota bacterium]OAE95779.1 transcriptional regulator [Idiomarina sp. WRN-38]MAD20799.1 transcriptional regulator SlyA [Halomonas sp.]MCC4289532.1 transcriptional regulator SlyA [Halomonas meridiana]|tara:strand:- start:851 stop:1303 length:453 start_codon:yes stop_codon:yes gene_type:complete